MRQANGYDTFGYWPFLSADEVDAVMRAHEDVEVWKQTFLKNGFTAPTYWYKIMTNGMEAQDEKQIPPERTFPPKESPIFFGACRLDYICVPENGYAVFKSEGFKDHDVTTYEFDADHWLFFSQAQEVCQELEKWIQLKKAGFK
ncbi:hypothetical protein NM688_g9319 [Phlebia brevispora]|uniref:Uncharacterized protein n=1 Tax=Phlebia brevispora TaxID=194682 RepID=A0ACC1RH08_9APHY|nr:hypothetical protein NM688_g9319 [Phlebia brevispora]